MVRVPRNSSAKRWTGSPYSACTCISYYFLKVLQHARLQFSLEFEVFLCSITDWGLESKRKSSLLSKLNPRLIPDLHVACRVTSVTKMSIRWRYHRRETSRLIEGEGEALTRNLHTLLLGALTKYGTRSSFTAGNGCRKPRLFIYATALSDRCESNLEEYFSGQNNFYALFSHLKIWTPRHAVRLSGKDSSSSKVSIVTYYLTRRFKLAFSQNK